MPSRTPGPPLVRVRRPIRPCTNVPAVEAAPAQATSRALGKRIPLATYRLQFNGQFTFAQATDVADFLAELGVSDCYCSPLFKAAPQSAHGYDVCSYDQLNPDLGTASDFERFAARLRQLGLGLLLDTVPNHMGADSSNPWWHDVLENGPASSYASWFDIDWQSERPGLTNKVLLPVLEDHYSKVLEAGKLQVAFDQRGFVVSYFERWFPLCPPSYICLLQEMLRVCSTRTPNSAARRDLELLIKSLRQPQSSSGSSPGQPSTTYALIANRAHLRECLAKALKQFNGASGKPHSFDSLHALLQKQHYRLAFWRIAPEEINYRRFFDVTQLVSLRVERPDVFHATHRLIFEMLRDGRITGLRIDHPDGLWDPKTYLQRMQAGASLIRASLSKQISLASQKDTARANASPEPSAAPLYIVVEKILTGDEPLPQYWPVDGTTGYDFLNRVNALFVSTANQSAFDQIYREFTGCETDFKTLVYKCKKKILESAFSGELRALAGRLKRIAAQTRYGQDFTLRQLETVLSAIIASFPVYRTYADETSTRLSEPETDYVLEASGLAGQRNPGINKAVLEFIRNLLLLETPEDCDERGNELCRELVLKFQQLTGPVMAKGLEDTAFYKYNRLVSLNDVGGDPSSFGISFKDFQAWLDSQRAHWPNSLLATATHDTKRGEDLRARISVLSEMPKRWRQALQRWRKMNGRHKTAARGVMAPDANDEYLLYQTLLGAWPTETGLDALASFRQRVTSYMLKALKEAKTHTSWTDPDPAYESAITIFIQKLLDESFSKQFLENFISFQRKVAFFGQFNSLSQLLIKITSPGVPDFYQGAELWDLNLVDPDNRGPVDFARRRQMLAELKSQWAGSRADQLALLNGLLRNWRSGQIKLHLTWRALKFRREHPQLFQKGDYLPLNATGPAGEHVCASARVFENQTCLSVVPRLVHTLVAGVERAPLGKETWHNTQLILPAAKTGQQYRNVLTGERLTVNPPGKALPLAEILRSFPVSLLVLTES